MNNLENTRDRNYFVLLLNTNHYDLEIKHKRNTFKKKVHYSQILGFLSQKKDFMGIQP